MTVCKKGFTLVELLIVITMLAVIAAIAVPRFLDASEDARESALGTDLQMLRRQIHLYKMQHIGRGPHLNESGSLDTGNLVARIIGKTDITGKLDANGGFGPYAKMWPTNPWAADAVAGDISFGTDAAPPRNDATGWYYNTDTGIISANSDKGALDLDP